MGGYQVPMCLKCFNHYTGYLLTQPLFIKQSFEKAVFGALVDTFESTEQHMELMQQVNKNLLATSAECYLMSKHWVEKQQASYKVTGKLLSLVK
jgi:hypothetical protein